MREEEQVHQSLQHIDWFLDICIRIRTIRDPTTSNAFLRDLSINYFLVIVRNNSNELKCLVYSKEKQHINVVRHFYIRFIEKKSKRYFTLQAYDRDQVHEPSVLRWSIDWPWIECNHIQIRLIIDFFWFWEY